MKWLANLMKWKYFMIIKVKSKYLQELNIKIRLIVITLLLSIAGRSYADEEIPGIPSILGQWFACFGDIKKGYEDKNTEEAWERFGFWAGSFSDIGLNIGLFKRDPETNGFKLNKNSQYHEAFMKSYKEIEKDESREFTCMMMEGIITYFIIGYDYGKNGNIGSFHEQ